MNRVNTLTRGRRFPLSLTQESNTSSPVDKLSSVPHRLRRATIGGEASPRTPTSGAMLQVSQGAAFADDLGNVKTTLECEKSQPHLLFAHEWSKNRNYHEQGDEEWDSPHNVAARERLSKDPEVVSGLDNFWLVVAQNRPAGSEQVAESEMVHIHMVCMKALFHPDEFELEMARQRSREDWQREMRAAREAGDVSADAILLPRARFYRSMFEVVDIWTPVISKWVYRKFLDKLFLRVTVRSVGEDGQLSSRWRDVDKVVPFSFDEDEGGGARATTRRQVRRRRAALLPTAPSPSPPKLARAWLMAQTQTWTIRMRIRRRQIQWKTTRSGCGGGRRRRRRRRPWAGTAAGEGGRHPQTQTMPTTAARVLAVPGRGPACRDAAAEGAGARWQRQIGPTPAAAVASRAA